MSCCSFHLMIEAASIQTYLQLENTVCNTQITKPPGWLALHSTALKLWNVRLQQATVCCKLYLL